jgi:hypothetical protein
VQSKANFQSGKENTGNSMSSKRGEGHSHTRKSICCQPIKQNGSSCHLQMKEPESENMTKTEQTGTGTVWPDGRSPVRRELNEEVPSFVLGAVDPIW